MGLLRKLFYRKPPDGLLEIADRVFVFDRCFTNEYREDKDYKGYIGGVVTPLRDQFPEASLLVFNFGNAEADAEPHLSQVFTEHDTTLMDYPSHYVGCPLLSMELVHHFLRSSESWLALGPHNLLLLHCQPGAWLVLAFMLAVLLLYRRLYSGELRTLDMVYKQAPPHLVSLLSPLNPVPSQLRYLQYVSRRNVASQWPPLDRTLLLDCIILRLIPNFSDEGGCRPLFRLYGPDPLAAADRTPKLLFATPHNSRALRLYKQAESEFVKIDINCNIQGDVVLECTNLQSDMEHEDVMFRIMFNTAFVRSNILILTRDEIDTLWNTKDNFPKDFRAEVLFSDTDATTSAATANSLCFEEKEGLPIEAFSKVQEFFSHVNWLDSRADAALSVMQKISASHDSCKISDSNDVRDSQSSTALHNSTPQKPKEESTPDINSNLKDQDSQRKLGSSNFGVRLDKHEPAQIIGDAHKTSSSMLSGAPATTNVLQSGSVHEDSSISAGPQATFISPSPPPPPPPPPPSSTLTVPFSSAEPKLSEDSARNLGAARSPPMTMLDTSAESSGDKLSRFIPPPLPTPPVPPSVDSAGTSGSSAPKVHSISPSKENYRKAGSPPAPPCPLKLDSPKSSSALVLPPPPLPPPPPPPSGSGLSSWVLESKPQASSSVPCTPPPPPPPPPPSGSGLSSRFIESKPQASSSIPCAPPPPANLSKAAPKTGTPIPAPAPPPGSLNVRGRNLSHSLGPKNPQNRKLKPLHWLKLTRAVQGSLWAETQKSGEATNAPEIDMSELENLFSASVPNADRRAATGKSRLASSGPKSEKVQLIDLRRAYNCEIMLSKVKVPLQELMVQVLSLEDSALDIDQVENLIKFCPTKEEMELLKGYTGEFDKLGKCEQFFLELMRVPRAEAKLRVFSFKMQFKTQVSDLRKSLNTVNSASDQIRSSVKLKRIMQTILQLGNALNQGTARGAAVGFRLDSLLKLTETRARNNKMTLMHYLCKVIAEKLPELLDFSNDLTSVEPASKIQLKFLAEEMQAVNKGLEKVVQELSSSENDGPVSEEFHKNLKEFLCFAEAEVRSLALLYSGVGRNVDALIVYFGEDPSRCPFEQVVTTLLNFLRMFNQAHEENCKQLEVEKKKAEKELQDRKEANQKEPDRLRGKIR